MQTSLITRLAPMFAALCVLGAGSAQAAVAAGTKGTPDCSTGLCTWSMMVDNVEVLSGAYAARADGSLFVPDQVTRFDLGDGGFVAVNGLSGNIDPILGFNVGAGTGALGKTFSFAFSLPIALSGTIDASSSVSYSLTSLTAAGAQVAPLFGRMVVAQEVDTTVGGLAPLNKGVDVGGSFFFVGGPQTANSPVYTASNSFVGSLDYDLMSVVVSFSLSPNSQVGMSGFVQQVLPIPEPTGALLMFAGLLTVAVVRRQRNA